MNYNTPYHKNKAVLQLFRKLDAQINQFKSASAINCLAGCSLCCTKPDIEAYPLEFLPFAYQSYREGQAEKFLELLRDQDSICVFYRPLQSESQKGGCSNYAYRGLICRLFGFASRLDKYRRVELVTCKPIKSHFPKNITAISEAKGNFNAPLLSNYYSRLGTIDSKLTGQIVPINQAVKEALEYVMAFYAYRPNKPRPLPLAG